MNQQAIEIKMKIAHPMRRDLVLNVTVCVLCIKVVKVRQLKQREDSHNQRIRLSGDHGRRQQGQALLYSVIRLYPPHAYAGGIFPPARACSLETCSFSATKSSIHMHSRSEKCQVGNCRLEIGTSHELDHCEKTTTRQNSLRNFQSTLVYFVFLGNLAP